MAELPPCGLYRTGRALGEIPAGRLVYFHNHGNPGAGIYAPQSWQQNRARFSESGVPIPDPAWAESLQPLRGEGFYRVSAPFECCDKKCRTYDGSMLVQLGYDAAGEAILFVPEWTTTGFTIPERGTKVAQDRLTQLEPLKVPGTSVGVDRLVH